MVTYTTAKAQLDAEWNALVIAKPTIENGQIRYSTLRPGFLFITMGKSTVKEMSLNAVLSEKKTLFTARIVAKDIADCENYIKETRRSWLAKSISGGWWRVIGEPLYKEEQHRVTATLLCEEILAINKTSWS